MMLEWYDRPFIPPPFIILAHVYRIVRNEIKKKNKWKSTNADFKLNHDPGLLKQLIKLEKKHAKDYVAQAKSCAFLKAGNVFISMSDEFQSVGAADLSEQPPYDTVLVLGTTSRAELL
ncbi:hypothetical protein DPMN_093320 [Dreissena polymorpha]|uniref:Uncharacterized protein n=1 Tax=Dreissena polymorpha TaxID=45954 RepID=A0A9D4R2F5_DREPO|nr:hypothetical protein DPMN_093320 [Dreissena polymorpha]